MSIVRNALLRRVASLYMLELNTAEKPYQCEFCLKSKCLICVIGIIQNSYKSELYHCEYCQKCFTHKGDLRKHIRTHTKDKPYQCEYYHKYFTRKGDLRKHIRTHIKEKLCGYCHKCFIQ